MALLANQVWQCIDLDMLDGAEFLAEQLIANDDTEDTRYLLGRVQYRREQYETAKLTTSGHLDSPGCLWVYCQSCLKLGQGEEGARVLEKSRKLWALDNDMPLPSPLGRGELSPAAFHFLLAKLLSLNDATQGLSEFAASARLNPYLFENVAVLCDSTQVKVKTETLFTRFEDPFTEALPHEMQSSNIHTLAAHTVPAEDVLPVLSHTTTSTPRRVETPHKLLSTPMPGKGALRTQLTALGSTSVAPNASITRHSPSIGGFMSNPNSRVASGLQNGGMPVLSTPVHGHLGGQQPQQLQQPQPANRRKKERILSLSFKRGDQSSLSSLGKGIFGTPNRSKDPSVFKHGLAAIEAIVSSMELMSVAERKAALDQLNSLDDAIRNTPFVLSLLGRILLELGEYHDSVQSFTRLREMQPDRVRGMEYLSTALWHLKRDQELALLAHELTQKGSPLRRAWQSWCTLGNAMSLRHDTQNALKCFQRATQINPRSAYAYTLMGYEYVSNEELNSAITAFAQALHADPQQYNAWYGLGSVNYSLGYYAKAQSYFAQAIRLNPNNPVLLCFMGAVLEALGYFSQALAQYERACQLNTSSPMPRYRKAEALLAVHMYREALTELLEVEKVAPEDSTVQYAIGRAYKGLGESKLAIQRFTCASQLAPRSSTAVRREIDEMMT